MELFQNLQCEGKGYHLAVDQRCTLVDMQEADHLSHCMELSSFQPSMTKYHREHRAYQFQMTVDVVFHKAVDPAVIIQPPVTLTSEMVAVYAGDAPALIDINRQFLNGKR